MSLLHKTLLAVLVASMGACASPGFGPAGGFYTSTKIGVSATQPQGAKTGQACAQTVLGLVAWGDASIQAAAAAGGITNIRTIDYHGLSILVWGRLCTVVQGD
ncbi:MAG: hypothetical protein HS115_04990 [Spirochaetales bacterium]|nr:hypothetical protein [Spirochaetales bacterium]